MTLKRTLLTLAVVAMGAAFLAAAPAQAKKCGPLCKDPRTACLAAVVKPPACILARCADLTGADKRTCKKECKQGAALGRKGCRQGILAACQADTDTTRCSATSALINSSSLF